VTRICVLISFALLQAVPALCESPQDQVEALAVAVRKGDVTGALGLFDPHAGSLAEIGRDLEALGALPNTYCTIAIARTSQTGDSITFTTDFALQTYPVQNGPMLDRRDTVTITLRRRENSWEITSFSPASVLAPPDGNVFKRIADLATDLNEKDQTDAMGAFDKGMRQYPEIDDDIDALVTQNDVLCAIDVVSDRQTGAVHTLDLDWYLDLKSRTDGGPSAQRRERVKVTMRQIKGKWKIDGMEPLSVLSPVIVR
jgi:hypothetical protein